jgi:hypothetical protein
MNLKEISEIDYNNSNLPILFEDKQIDRVFGIISNYKHSFRLAWQSTIVKPVVKEVDEEIYAIGIDRNFVLFDLKLVKIVAKIELNYFFYDLVIYDNFIVVITELEIFIVNKLSYQVVKDFPLSDIYSKMEITEQNMKFICIDGSEVDFYIEK